MIDLTPKIQIAIYDNTQICSFTFVLQRQRTEISCNSLSLSLCTKRWGFLLCLVLLKLSGQLTTPPPPTLSLSGSLSLWGFKYLNQYKAYNLSGFQPITGQKPSCQLLLLGHTWTPLAYQGGQTNSLNVTIWQHLQPLKHPTDWEGCPKQLLSTARSWNQ